MNKAPELLLAHHLKTLRLPTFLREHDKQARICAVEGLDHVRYLARLTELELARCDWTERRENVIALGPNYAQWLKTPNGLTPFEYICKIWTKHLIKLPSSM